jgi:serine/threonine protein kinase/WD40 repeat protein
MTPGARVGAYRLLEKLGEGGMGVVFKAQDERRSRLVALKVASPAVARDEVLRKRFAREARAAARVASPHVASVIDVGEHEGLPFIVLELLPGGSLGDVVKRDGPLPWRRAAERGLQIARGLQAIHAAGLVHRDLKPDNVLLDASGVCKITDFGLVGVTDEAGMTLTRDLTQTGEILGTVAFMSPEQADGKRAGSEADVYALGATLYYLLSGKTLFAGSGLMLLKKILMDTPIPLAKAAPGVPVELVAVVERMLAKDPAARGNAARAASDLTGLLAARRTAPRRSAALGIMAALAAAGAVVVLASSRRGTKESPPLPPPPAPRPVVESSIACADSATAEYAEKIRFSRDRRLRLVRVFGSSVRTGSAWIPALTFSPDGKRVAIASGRQVHEFDAGSGRELAEHPTPGEEETRVAWRGDLIAASTRAHAAHLWNVKAGQHLRLQHGGEVRDVDFSPDGRSVVTASRDASVTLWETATGKRSWTKTHGAPVETARFARSGDLVASGDGQGVVKLRDARTGKEVGTVPVAPGIAIRSISFSADDRAIVAAGDAKEIFVLDTGTARRVQTIEVSSGAGIPCVACSPVDADVVASVSTDGFVRLTRISDGHEVASGDLRTRGLAVAWSPDGLGLATSGENTTWRLWTVSADRRLVEVDPPQGRHTDAPLTVHFASGGPRFVTAGRDGTARLWDTRLSSSVSMFGKPRTWSCKGAVFMPGERRVLVGCVENDKGGGMMGIWDPAERESTTLENELEKCGYIVDAARGGRIAFTADTEGIHAWNLSEDRYEFKNFTGSSTHNLKAIACSRDGSRVLVAGEILGLWTLPGSAVEHVSQRTAYSAAFLGEDGKRFLVAFEDGSVELHDQGGRSHVSLRPHAGSASLVCASPDGSLALSAGTDGNVRLWSMSKKMEEGDAPLDELDLGPATDVAKCGEFTPDGRTVVIGTYRGLILEYDVRAP